MAIRTRVTELLGIEHPIIQGGMAWTATWELAAAVSKPGCRGFSASKPSMSFRLNGAAALTRSGSSSSENLDEPEARASPRRLTARRRSEQAPDAHADAEMVVGYDDANRVGGDRRCHSRLTLTFGYQSAAGCSLARLVAYKT